MTHLGISKENYKKIQEITITDYEVLDFVTKVLIKEDFIEPLIENLLVAYDSLKEEFEDYKRNVVDNYRQIPIAEQVGISDEDFIC